MRPNVLLLVWDACRLDAAREHAPTLASLAEDNLWFENAITPAGTSLPSHTSMVTGTHPHEHGTYRQSHEIDDVPLVTDFGTAGYRTVGVSANGFASAKYGFDEPFDEFYNTQGITVSPRGLDLHGYARRASKSDEEFSTDDVDALSLLSSVVRHDYPIKSALNVAAAGLSDLVGRYDTLQRVPHPRFNKYNEFCYDPSDNTELLIEAFQNAATDDRPLFAFSNYMDSHHPYAPPTHHQWELVGRDFSYRELAELSEVSHPFSYLERLEAEGQLPRDTLDDIRSLYLGEVRTADEHLEQLLDALERTGLRDDTLVIVTADHGENLGETNDMGETRMGHVCSAGDHHLRVPLVMAHPDLEGRSVEEYVSLKDLAPLLTHGLDGLLESGGHDLGPLIPEDGVVATEVPATDNEALRERYPVFEDVLQRHLVATYGEGWKLVCSSSGDEYAWENGTERNPGDAPGAIRDTCREYLDELIETDAPDRELSDAEKSHLEALGYL